MVDTGGIAGITIGIVAGIPLLLAVILEIYNRTTARNFDVKGKHVYITGGSKGLGKALARILLERGANVTIVASQRDGLDAATKELGPVAKSGQSLVALQANLLDEARAVAVFHEAVEKQGNVPEYVFCCAGIANPQFFLDLKFEDFREIMNLNYMAALITAHTALKEYMKANQKGNIIFVSSLVGLFSFIGYSSYSPTKYALRGLAEALRSEFTNFGINFHVFFPGSIDSPGFEHENKIKPDIMKKIEESDVIYSPHDSAVTLLKGIKNGNFFITVDLIGHLARATGRCSAPSNNYVLDAVYTLIGIIGFPIWRIITDGEIQSWKKREDKKFPSKTDKLE